MGVQRGMRDGLICPIDGDTVLKPAAVTVLERLLSAGAAVNFGGPDGRGALHIACKSGTAGVAMAKVLLSWGSDPFFVDSEGVSPWDLVQCSDSDELRELFANFERPATD